MTGNMLHTSWALPHRALSGFNDFMVKHAHAPGPELKIAENARAATNYHPEQYVRAHGITRTQTDDFRSPVHRPRERAVKLLSIGTTFSLENQRAVHEHFLKPSM
jgi:hypothetical protein